MNMFKVSALMVFSDPHHPTGYNDRCIMDDLVIDVFKEFMKHTQEEESSEYMRTLSGMSLIFNLISSADFLCSYLSQAYLSASTGFSRAHLKLPLLIRSSGSASKSLKEGYLMPLMRRMK